MARKKVIPAVEVEEEIHAFTHTPGRGVSVAVGVGQRGPNGFEFWRNQTFETIHIVGRDYEDLMSVDGAGLLPGKPPGVFRLDDLWPFIDRIRDRKARNA